jgi:hypothetical protein
MSTSLNILYEKLNSCQFLDEFYQVQSFLDRESKENLRRVNKFMTNLINSFQHNLVMSPKLKNRTIIQLEFKNRDLLINILGRYSHLQRVALRDFYDKHNILLKALIKQISEKPVSYEAISLQEIQSVPSLKVFRRPDKPNKEMETCAQLTYGVVEAFFKGTLPKDFNFEQHSTSSLLIEPHVHRLLEQQKNLKSLSLRGKSLKLEKPFNFEQSLRLETLTLREFEGFEAGMLESIASTYLQTLDLASKAHVILNDPCFKARSLPFLKMLKLKNIKLPSSFFSRLGENCPDLKVFIYNVPISNQNLLDLVQGASLTALSLNFSGISQEDFDKALSRLSKLKMLKMHNLGRSRISLMSIETGSVPAYEGCGKDINSLAQKCQNLQRLELCYVENALFSGTGLTDIAKHCSRLSHLTLKNCSKLNFSTLENFMDEAKQLKCLTIHSKNMKFCNKLKKAASNYKMQINLNKETLNNKGEGP